MDGAGYKGVRRLDIKAFTPARLRDAGIMGSLEQCRADNEQLTLEVQRLTRELGAMQVALGLDVPLM